MVKDIADNVAKLGVEVSILTQSNFTEKRKIGKLNIIKKTLSDIIANIKPFYCFLGVKACFAEGTFRKKLNVLFYFLSGGFIEKAIKESHSDLVHIHGIGFYSVPFIIACIRCEVPFIVTLHGLVSLSDAIKIAQKEREIEKQFVRLSTQRQIPITVVSSGMKTRIRGDFSILTDDNISVIQNGSDIRRCCTQNIYDIKIRHGILPNEKVVLCVGTICERKNQVQVIRALSYMNLKIRAGLKVLFLGNDTLNGLVQAEADRCGLKDNVVFCGAVPKLEMASYYAAASFNVTASIDEGFGLPITEAFIYGIPTTCFGDIDAVPDLYDEKCMVVAKVRSDEALAEAISDMCQRTWDKSYIQKYSERFSLEIMANKYINLYNSPIKSEVKCQEIVEIVAG